MSSALTRGSLVGTGIPVRYRTHREQAELRTMVCRPWMPKINCEVKCVESPNYVFSLLPIIINASHWLLTEVRSHDASRQLAVTVVSRCPTTMIRYRELLWLSKKLVRNGLSDSWRPAAATSRSMTTHEVFNQATPLEDINLFTNDAHLVGAVKAFGADWANAVLAECGSQYGSAETMENARLANKHRPELQTHDRVGNRINSVEFHPAYHQLMQLGKEMQLPSFGWNPKQPSSSSSSSSSSGALSDTALPSTPKYLHTARAALPYIGNQIEAGTMCPLTMTYAAVPALRHCPDVAADWVPGVVQPRYDPRDIPAPEKAGLTVGMSMTEKQVDAY